MFGMPNPRTALSLLSVRHRAFTLVELLVVIGIIVLLLAILLPVLGNVRAESRTVVCASNLRQIGQALGLYATEYKGRQPPNINLPHPSQLWCDPDRIGKYLALPPTGSVPTNTVYVCPSDELSRLSYSMNVWTSSKFDQTFLKDPSRGKQWPDNTSLDPQVILVTEGWSWSGSALTGYAAPAIIGLYGSTAAQKFGAGTGISPPVSAGRWGLVNCELAYMRHRKRGDTTTGTKPHGRVNILFADGRVELLSNEDLVNSSSGVVSGAAIWSPNDITN